VGIPLSELRASGTRRTQVCHAFHSATCSVLRWAGILRRRGGIGGSPPVCTCVFRAFQNAHFGRPFFGAPGRAPICTVSEDLLEQRPPHRASAVTCLLRARSFRVMAMRRRRTLRPIDGCTLFMERTISPNQLTDGYASSSARNAACFANRSHPSAISTFARLTSGSVVVASASDHASAARRSQSAVVMVGCICNRYFDHCDSVEGA
jgi:hypothetical protein